MATTSSSSAPLFGITLTIAALFQVVVYASVVLYSLYLGAIDLVIPVKTAFLAMIFVIAVKALGDIVIAWRSRSYDPSRFIDGVIFFTIEAIGAVSFLLFAFLFLSQPLSNIDLTRQNFEVRALASLGVVLLLVLTLAQIRDLFRLRIGKRDVKTVEVE